VPGRVEDAMQRQRQLDDAEVRRKVAPGLGDGVENEIADLDRELLKLFGVQAPKVGGSVDVVEHALSWWRHRLKAYRRRLRSGKNPGCSHKPSHLGRMLLPYPGPVRIPKEDQNETETIDSPACRA